MKLRILFTLAALLATFLSFAQSLDGTWTATMMMDENKDTADVKMNLSAKGIDTFVISDSSYSEQQEFSFSITASKDGETITMTATIIGKTSGTMTREGDFLVFTPAKGVKPEITTKTDKNFPGIIKTLLVNPCKNEMAKDLKQEQRTRLVSLSGDEMILEETLTEKEIKKGQKPEQYSYKRK